MPEITKINVNGTPYDIGGNLKCKDVTNDTTYDITFQLYQGKPRLVYDDGVEEEEENS